MPRHLIVGTAGHIDHGKTALVHALTGVDTDRLPEEKRRGITIDLGFARMDLGPELEISIVDVPGHEAFIRNMVAGATGIDIVVLVVAADEGVMPQTREHLAIVELLGVTRAIVALTKSDLVEPAWLDLVRDEVQELLLATALADSPIIAVSARTGDGLAQLTAAIADAASAVAPRASEDLFRMPIDRVFTVRGTGTVVTGTVWSGSLQRDQQVRIEPAGLTARVRALQRHGSDAGVVHAGERAAVALTGIDRALLTRGDTLLTAPAWTPAATLTVQLHVLRDAGSAIRPRQRVRVHLGTAEVLGRIGLLARELAPDDAEIVQLRLEEPLVARAGDRVIIRSYSPIHTIAGATVLEPTAAKRKRVGDSERAALQHLRTGAPVEGVLHLHGAAGVPRALLPILTGLPPADAHTAATAMGAVPVGELLVDRAHLQACRDRVLASLAAFHSTQPLHDGMEREALRRAAAAPAALVETAMQQLAGEGAIVFPGGLAALPTHRPTPAPAQQVVLDRLRTIFAQAGLQPPDVDEIPDATPDTLRLLQLLEREGALVRMSASRWIDAASLDAATAALRLRLPAGQPLGIAEFRDVLDLSRKHLIPLLEYFDRTGVTTRAGDQRVLSQAAAMAAS